MEMSAYDDIFAEVVTGKNSASSKYDSAMPKIDVMAGSLMNQDFTEGMTEGQKFAAGIGKWATDRVLGAKQLIGMASADDAKKKAKMDESLVRGNSAGALGEFAGNMLPAIAFPTQGIRGAAMLGAAQGLTDPITGGGRGEGYPNVLAHKFGNATFDALMAGSTQALFNRLINGAAPKTPEQAAAREFAKNELKTPMTAGQMTAEPATKTVSFAQRLERQAAGMPTTKGYFDNVAERQNADVKDFIENKLLTADYNTWGAGKTVNFDPQFRGDVGAIRGNFDMMPNTPTAVPELERQASILLKQRQLPAIGPKDEFNSAQGLRRMYAAKSNPTGGQTTVPEDKAAYQSFVKALDDAIERSVPGYKDVRGTYQIEKTLQPAKITNPNGQEFYDITKVGSAIRKLDAKNPSILDNLGARGEQLRNLANFAEHAKMANTSGTSENILAQKLMLNPWVGNVALSGLGTGMGAGYGYATGQDPMQTAAIGGAAGLLAPVITNALLQAGVKGLAPDLAANMRAKNPFTADMLARLRNAPVYGLLPDNIYGN